MNHQYRFWGKAKPQAAEKVFSLAVPRGSADQATATIRMYGPIDSWGGIWGVSAEEVSQALDSLPASVTNIQLRINSPGGECSEGMAILNMLRAHPAKVTAVVDGIAASAASFIAAGCDETVMSPGTQMMIHDAWGLAIGNAADMAKMQAALNSISDSIADLYVDSAGGYRAKWRTLMSAETWFTAKEAVSAGLAGSVAVVPDRGTTTTAGSDPEPAEDSDDTDGEPFDKFDLSVFKYEGRANAPAPQVQDVDTAQPDAAVEAADPAAQAAGSAADAAEEGRSAALSAALDVTELALLMSSQFSGS